METGQGDRLHQGKRESITSVPKPPELAAQEIVDRVTE